MRNFEAQPLRNGLLIRTLLQRDRQAFLRHAIDVFGTETENGGYQYVLSLLLGHDLLLPALADPALPREKAVALAKAALRLEPAVDQDLGKALETAAGEGETRDLSRILDILVEASDGGRLAEAVAASARGAPDANARAKAAQAAGRETRNARWLETPPERRRPKGPRQCHRGRSGASGTGR